MAADGNWNLVIETPMGQRQATLSVKTEGSQLTGSQSAEGRSIDIFDGAAKGNEVSWKVAINDPMDMTLEFTGAVDGDQMSGSVKLGPFGDSQFSGSRAYSDAAKSVEVESVFSREHRGGGGLAHRFSATFLAPNRKKHSTSGLSYRARRREWRLPGELPVRCGRV